MNNIILFEDDNNKLFFNRDVKHLVFKYDDIHYKTIIEDRITEDE